jgi:hypothetical protein
VFISKHIESQIKHHTKTKKTTMYTEKSSDNVFVIQELSRNDPELITEVLLKENNNVSSVDVD